jgi:hypothetical protein
MGAVYSRSIGFTSQRCVDDKLTKNSVLMCFNNPEPSQHAGAGLLLLHGLFFLRLNALANNGEVMDVRQPTSDSETNRQI